MHFGDKLKTYYLLLLTYILSGIYVFSIVLNTPLIDISLNQVNSNYVIQDMTYSKWAQKHDVNEGDIILQINGIPIHQFTQIEYDPYIRAAETILIKSGDENIREVPIQYKDLPEQWIMQVVIPSLYFILSIITVLYLYIKKQNIPSIRLLIAFNLAVSLAYISSGASARMDMLGVFVNSGCLLLSLVLLLHFIKHYLHFWNIPNKLLSNIKYLYILPFVAIFIRCCRFIYPPFAGTDSFIILILLSVLVIYTLSIFAVIYGKSRLLQLKSLFIGLIIPFTPFILLFLLPEILLGKYILSAEICTVFFLLLPFNVIFFHLTERLYDFTYHITRIRYYLIIAMFFSVWIASGLYLFIDLKISEVILTFLFITLSLIILLYIKENFDFHGRKILFSSKGNYIHQLYQTIQKLGTVYSINELLTVLSQEISNHLEIDNIYIVIYDFKNKEFSKNDHLAHSIDDRNLLLLPTGTVVKNKQFYLATIHEDVNFKRFLFIDHNKNIRLKPEELLWIELSLAYTSIFIENTKIIEELIAELNLLKQEHINEPSWMKKLLWFKIENEKFILAQDLHDTILQENISIARQLDKLIYDTTQQHAKPEHLADIHYQMLHSIQQLRLYCETLKPPLLFQMGLNTALERLFEKIQSQAHFTLDTTIDRMYLENDQAILSIYRIIQELLNNAIKHSEASLVTISVFESVQGIEIIYQDNGVGCDISMLDQSETLGVYGIKERVHALNGEVLIKSNKNKGFSMKLFIKESENSNDFNFNNR